MRFAFLFLTLALINKHNTQVKTFRFDGQFVASEFSDGHFFYTFVGADGEKEVFVQAHDWDTLAYDFQRIELYQHKWFEIHYYGVGYDIGEEENKRWFKRIRAVRMIPGPGTKFYTFNGKFRSASTQEGAAHYTFVALNGKTKELMHDPKWSHFPYDFLDETANTNLSHVDQWFKITYYRVSRIKGAASKTRFRMIYTIKMISGPHDNQRYKFGQ
jgi:hypothetical protein